MQCASADLLPLLAQVAPQSHDQAEMLQQFQECLSSGEASAQELRFMANFLWRAADQADAAEAFLDAALLLDPEDPAGLFEYGMFLDQVRGNRIAAAASYDKCLALAPKEFKPQVGLNLGALLIQLAVAAQMEEASAPAEAAVGAENSMTENARVAASKTATTATTSSAAAWRQNAAAKRQAAKAKAKVAAANAKACKGKASAGSQQLFARAREVLVEVEEAAPGQGSYNMACLEAQRGDAAACQRWIQRGAKYGALPPSEDMAADDDLASVVGEAWFAPLMAEVAAAAADRKNEEMGTGMDTDDMDLDAQMQEAGLD